MIISHQGALTETSQNMDSNLSHSRSRRKSSIFPSFLRSNANSKEVLNSSDSSGTIDNDPVPSAEFYEHENTTCSAKSRPTFEDFQNSVWRPTKSGEEQKAKTVQSYKLGWINGVYLRTVLNIWGVEMFIRMSWMVGQSGLVVSVFQIILSTLITIVTTLSMSAICTNGKIGTGGTYYMISRSLGPEAGTAIGTITYFSMCVLNSLNIVGAAEGIVMMLKEFEWSSGVIDGAINDIRLYSCIILVIIAIVPLFGMAWESKTHHVLFLLLIVSLADYGIGTVYGIDANKNSKGLIGWNMTVIKANLWPDYRYNENFYTVLAVFFPMVTGIFAGSAMSGDLKDPGTAIPKGTLSAIVTTSISYALILIFLGCTVVRYSTGAQNFLEFQDICADPKNCPFGLLNDYQAMKLTSNTSFLVYLGIQISAMSSSLACYVAAPRMFQAFSKDKLFPYISWFGKTHGKNNEPMRGYLITFIISLIFCLWGHLNDIAPIISTFKLASFFLVNITCFHASYINSPSFRPSFKYFNKWLSLVVAVICLVFMFFIQFFCAIITVILSLCVFVIVNKRSPDVCWGSTSEDQVFTNSLSNLIRLNEIPNHVKNYRPCILLLSGNPSARMPLVALARDMTSKVGLLLVGQVTKTGKLDPKRHQKVVENQNGWLKHKKIKGFYLLNQCDSISSGARNMIQLSGIGKMRANILMIGFKSNWRFCSENELEDYYLTINTAIEMCLSLVIFRLEHGCDYSTNLAPRNSQLYSIEYNSTDVVHCNKAFQNDFDEMSTSVTIPINDNQTDAIEDATEHEDDVFTNAAANGISKNNFDEFNEHDRAIRTGEFAVFTAISGRTPEQITKQVEMFDAKQPKGFIDVWTNDDGGLTLLLPYILSKNKRWNNSKLRVFTVVDPDANYSQENLKKLLKQFRIPFSDVLVLTNCQGEPSKLRKQQFKSLVEKFMIDDTCEQRTNSSLTKETLLKFKDKTCKILKIRDMMETHSKSSNMVVITLPIVSKHSCPAALYLAWIDLLSGGMPPFVFVRGNQSNVLTFYL